MIVTVRVAKSWNCWKHVSSHLKNLAATFGWLGQRPEVQPTNYIFFSWMPANWLEDSQMSVMQLNRSFLGASQMAGTQPNSFTPKIHKNFKQQICLNVHVILQPLWSEKNCVSSHFLFCATLVTVLSVLPIMTVMAEVMVNKIEMSAKLKCQQN